MGSVFELTEYIPTKMLGKMQSGVSVCLKSYWSIVILFYMEVHFFCLGGDIQKFFEYCVLLCGPHFPLPCFPSPIGVQRWRVFNPLPNGFACNVFPLLNGFACKVFPLPTILYGWWCSYTNPHLRPSPSVRDDGLELLFSHPFCHTKP